MGANIPYGQNFFERARDDSVSEGMQAAVIAKGPFPFTQTNNTRLIVIAL